MNKKTNPALNLVLCAFLVFGLVGCTVVKILARGTQPIVLNSLPEKFTVLGHFKQSKEVTFDYTRAPDVSAAIREGMAAYPNADAAVNVFITVENTVGDFFFNLFTLGFANAFTLTVEGDAIQYGK